MSKGKGGWPSKTGNPSGKGRDNNPSHNPSGGGRDISSVADKINAVATVLTSIAVIGELAISAIKKLHKWRLSRKKVVRNPNSVDQKELNQSLKDLSSVKKETD